MPMMPVPQHSYRSDYLIIEADTPEDLVEKVSQKLVEGYSLAGGPFVAPVATGHGYAYAVGATNYAFICARFMQAVIR